MLIQAFLAESKRRIKESNNPFLPPEPLLQAITAVVLRKSSRRSCSGHSSFMNAVTDLLFHLHLCSSQLRLVATECPTLTFISIAFCSCLATSLNRLTGACWKQISFSFFGPKQEMVENKKKAMGRYHMLYSPPLTHCELPGFFKQPES